MPHNKKCSKCSSAISDCALCSSPTVCNKCSTLYLSSSKSAC